jgi:hypothetical protein
VNEGTADYGSKNECNHGDGYQNYEHGNPELQRVTKTDFDNSSVAQAANYSEI